METKGKLLHLDIWLGEDTPLFPASCIGKSNILIHVAYWILREIVLFLDLHVVEEILHYFPGGGETCVFILEESHVAIHTYPEHRYFSIDLYTCGDYEPEEVIELFNEKMDEYKIQKMQHGVVIRGVQRVV